MDGDFIELQEGIPPDVAAKIKEQQLLMYTSQGTTLPDSKKMRERHMKAKIAPGAAVGIIASQSVGERATQSLLSSFHLPGQSQVILTTGIPRVKELLQATKNPSAVVNVLYMRDRAMIPENLRHVLGSSITEVTLGKIMKRNRAKSRELTGYEIMVGILPQIYHYRITPEDILDALISIGYECTLNQEPNQDNFEIQIQVDEDTCISDLMDVKIAGIKGVKEYYFMKDNDEWLVHAIGSAVLTELVRSPIVDQRRVTSNNPHDIAFLLGIEAAREILFRELCANMDGVNLCHIRLLVDRMTFKGIWQSLDRYTLRSDEIGPLGKATFEQPLDCALLGGVDMQKDHINTISMSVLTGTRARVGTGFMDVMVDSKMLTGTLQPPSIYTK